MSLKDRILGATATNTDIGEESEMTQQTENFQAEVAQSFMTRLRDGKYEIQEGYGGDNLQERIMGGGSPLGPYQHGANMLKGPQASMGRPAGASWQYNPVDVRPDVEHRAKKMPKSGVEKAMKSPTPAGVPVDVRADTAKKTPKFKLRSDTAMSPTKSGWSGTRMESQESPSANLLESIEATVQTLFG